MKRVKQLLFLLLALIFLFSPLPVLAEKKTFDVNKDTYANEVYPDKVSGSFGSVTLSNKYTNRLGYLLFQDVNLPEGAILDRGVIKIYLFERHYADSAKVNVGPVTGSWEENSLTWNNKPTINQTQASEAIISLTSDGWQEIPITNLVRQWLEGTLDNKGVFIYPYGFLYSAPETEFALSFKSKESGDLKAKLEVEYHLEAEPTLSPAPTAEPTPTSTDQTSPSPTEEESTPEALSPTPEEEKEATPTGLSTGQIIIGGTIFLSLAGAGAALLFYALRKPKKAPEKKAPKPEPKEKK